MRNSISLSPETEAKTEAARQALGILRKTFEQWTVIGAAIVALRERANNIGGRKTFHRLLEQQGLGTFVQAKAITSRLEKVMAHLPEVMAWHQKLSPHQQIEWASPSSACLRCPVLQSPDKQPRPRPQPAVAKPENLAKVMEQQEARIEELEQELAAARDKQPALTGEGLPDDDDLNAILNMIYQIGRKANIDTSDYPDTWNAEATETVLGLVEQGWTADWIGEVRELHRTRWRRHSTISRCTKKITQKITPSFWLPAR